MCVCVCVLRSTWLYDPLVTVSVSVFPSFFLEENCHGVVVVGGGVVAVFGMLVLIVVEGGVAVGSS